MNTLNIPTIAMILAAGLGKRMQPLTSTRPKPLIKVGGIAVIDRTLKHIGEAGISKAVVNVHYMADMMEEHLSNSKAPPEIIISDERESLLETGGGITKALPHLGNNPFFTINSDAIWQDGPENTFHKLAHGYVHEDEVHLLIIKTDLAYGYYGEGYTGKGDFFLKDDGQLEWRKGRDYAPYMFGGITLMSPKLFQDKKPEPFSSLEIFIKAQEAGKLFGHVHNGHWYHVGCPKAVGDIEVLLEQHGDDYIKGKR